MLRKAYQGYGYKAEDESESEGAEAVNVDAVNRRNGHIY